MRVVISGGGLSALSNAVQLLRVGASVTLISPAAPAWPGYSGLWSPSLRVLQDLDILSEVESKGMHLGTRTQGYKSWQQRDPRSWMMRPKEGLSLSPDSPALLFVENSQLLSALYRKMHTLGQKSSLSEKRGVVSAIDTKGKVVQLDDASRVPYDILIGADGSYSAVRLAAGVGAQTGLRYRGYYVFRGHVSQQMIDERFRPSSAELLRQQAWQTFGPSSRFAVVPTKEGYCWFFAVTAAAPSAGDRHRGAPAAPLQNQSRPASQEELASLFALAATFHEPTLELLQNTPSGTVTACPAFSSSVDAIQAPPSALPDSVLLTGDARCTHDPILAVGAGLALEDSKHLVTALQSGPLSSCGARLEALRVPRLSRLSLLSSAAQLVGHVESPALCAVRDALLSSLPSPLLGAVLDQVIKKSVQ